MSAAIPPATKRRKYRTIEEEEEPPQISQPQLPGIGADVLSAQQQLDIFDALRLCDAANDASLLPILQQFANRIGIPNWATLSKENLCGAIRNEVSMTDLPPDILFRLSKYLPKEMRARLQASAMTTKMLLPPVTRAQQFLDTYGGRVYQILFGTQRGQTQQDLTVSEYNAAEKFALENATFFAQNDIARLHTEYSANGAQPSPFRNYVVEFVPKILRTVHPASRYAIAAEVQRQIRLHPTLLPVRIHLVCIQRVSDVGYDTTLVAEIMISRVTASTHTASIYEHVHTNKKSEYEQARLKLEKDFTADPDYIKLEEYFYNNATGGWWIVEVDRDHQHLGIVSFLTECGTFPRSTIARAYYEAQKWALEYAENHQELHPIFDDIPDPKTTRTLWKSKAMEEQAIRDLMGYEVYSPATDKWVELPLRSWLTAITSSATYKSIAKQLLPPTEQSHFNLIVFRYASPKILDTMFRKLQSYVRDWWQKNVFYNVPQRASVPTAPLFPILAPPVQNNMGFVFGGGINPFANN